jgi:hypothetical protein
MKSDRDWLVGRSGLFAEPGDRVIAASLYFLWERSGRPDFGMGIRMDTWTVNKVIYPANDGMPRLVLGGRLSPVLSTNSVLSTDYIIVNAVDSSLLTSS